MNGAWAACRAARGARGEGGDLRLLPLLRLELSRLPRLRTPQPASNRCQSGATAPPQLHRNSIRAEDARSAARARAGQRRTIFASSACCCSSCSAANASCCCFCRRKGPYCTVAHTAPHTALHLNKNGEALRQRKLPTPLAAASAPATRRTRLYSRQFTH